MQHARRNAVDRAGKDFADAHGAHGVDGAGRFGRRFERQNQLCRRGQRIFAAGHQLAAGVAAFAFDHNALAGRRGNVRHQANVESFLLEKRPLLDVQLNKLMKAAGGTATDSSEPVNPACARNSSRPRPSLSRSASACCGREHVGHHAAAQAADAEARGLLGREDDEFDRAARLESELLAAREWLQGRRARPRIRRRGRRWEWRRCASRCRWARASGSLPSQRAKVLPMASSRTREPRFCAQALARKRGRACPPR